MFIEGAEPRKAKYNINFLSGDSKLILIRCCNGSFKFREDDICIANKVELALPWQSIKNEASELKKWAY